MITSPCFLKIIIIIITLPVAGGAGDDSTTL